MILITEFIQQYNNNNMVPTISKHYDQKNYFKLSRYTVLSSLIKYEVGSYLKKTENTNFTKAQMNLRQLPKYLLDFKNTICQVLHLTNTAKKTFHYFVLIRNTTLLIFYFRSHKPFKNCQLKNL